LHQLIKDSELFAHLNKYLGFDVDLIKATSCEPRNLDRSFSIIAPVCGRPQRARCRTVGIASTGMPSPSSLDSARVHTFVPSRDGGRKAVI
jgi:hypothetical protein